LSIVTFDFWIAIQDLPNSNRHPSLTQDILTNLLYILLQQSEYDFCKELNLTNINDLYYDDNNLTIFDITNFRHHQNGVDEVITCCYLNLQDNFFIILNTILQQIIQNYQIVNLTNNAHEIVKFCQKLETLLFILISSWETIQENLQSSITFPLNLSKLEFQFLFSFLQYFLTNLNFFLQISQNFDFLTKQISRLFGKIGFLLLYVEDYPNSDGSPNPRPSFTYSRYVQVILYLYQILCLNLKISIDVSNSLVSLCTQGSNISLTHMNDIIITNPLFSNEIGQTNSLPTSLYHFLIDKFNNDILMNLPNFANLNAFVNICEVFCQITTKDIEYNIHIYQNQNNHVFFTIICQKLMTDMNHYFEMDIRLLSQVHMIHFHDIIKYLSRIVKKLESLNLSNLKFQSFVNEFSTNFWFLIQNVFEHSKNKDVFFTNDNICQYFIFVLSNLIKLFEYNFIISNFITSKICQILQFITNLNMNKIDKYFSHGFEVGNQFLSKFHENFSRGEFLSPSLVFLWLCIFEFLPY
jgi:hypothetical protein